MTQQLGLKFSTGSQFYKQSLTLVKFFAALNQIERVVILIGIRHRLYEVDRRQNLLIRLVPKGFNLERKHVDGGSFSFLTLAAATSATRWTSSSSSASTRRRRTTSTSSSSRIGAASRSRNIRFLVREFGIWKRRRVLNAVTISFLVHRFTQWS